MRRIVITGGHHNSALVVAENLRSRGHRVFWFGHKFTMINDKRPGAEYHEVTRAGFEFIEIKAGKISRTHHLIHFLRFPLGFIQSLYYLLKYQPDLIFSFGGYLAVPVIFCGWLLRIPSITHEQTVVYGLANRVIERFAKKILVSWRNSLKHFPREKVVFTGLPLRPEILASSKRLDFKNQLPTIYITGGKQGSHVINRAVEAALPDFLKKYNLIHQCGSSTVYDDFSHLGRVKMELRPKLGQRYVLRDYIFREEIGRIFKSADLVVGRAGAHIVYEIAVLGKPALFIPIPWSRGGEQAKNAQILVEAGIAKILPQKELSSKKLLQLIEGMIINLGRYKKNVLRAQKLVKKDAAKKIVDLVEKL